MSSEAHLRKHRGKRAAAVLGALAVCLIALMLVAREFNNQPDWAKTTSITFAVWTNGSAKPQPVFLIQNSSASSVKIEALEFEYIGFRPHAPVAGVTNVVQRLNIPLTICGPNSSQEFAAPAPERGTNWLARFWISSPNSKLLKDRVADLPVPASLRFNWLPPKGSFRIDFRQVPFSQQDMQRGTTHPD